MRRKSSKVCAAVCAQSPISLNLGCFNPGSRPAMTYGHNAPWSCFLISNGSTSEQSITIPICLNILPLSRPSQTITSWVWVSRTQGMYIPSSSHRSHFSSLGKVSSGKWLSVKMPCTSWAVKKQWLQTMLAGEHTSKKILPTYPTSLVISVISPLVEDHQWAQKKVGVEIEQWQKKTHSQRSQLHVTGCAFRV